MASGVTRSTPYITGSNTRISLRRLLGAMDSAGPLSKLLNFVPTAGKYLVFLVFVLNIRSWPSMWHFRVFRRVFYLRWRFLLVQLRTMFSSKSKKMEAEEKWFDDLSLVGDDPWKFEVRYNTFAGLDDCDFNGHLSNSSYPKAVDAARFKAGLTMCPRFFAAGGWMPLAATHFKFIREIPMLTPYEVRMSIGGWDHKWFYIVAKFVTKPKSKKTVPSTKTTNGTTPTNPDDKLSSPPSNGKVEPETEEDGAILHTIGVAQLCCKIGRITIPPAVVLALSGFSMAPPPSSSLSTPDGDFASQPETKSTPQRYSHTNPPPHWLEAKRIQARTHGGSFRKLRTFFKGGWKDVPVEERWWDTALGGEVEEGRKKAMEMLDGLAEGFSVGK